MSTLGRRTLVVVVAVLLLATGCDWNRLGYDLGGSRFNASDSGVNNFNEATLTTAWRGTTGASIGVSSPTTSGGHVFIGSQDGVVYSFDEFGVSDCTAGVPIGCSPQWTSVAQGSPIHSSPTPAGNGTLLVGGGNDVLYAYDSSGTNGCSGSPTVCQPLWTAPGTGGGDMSSAVANNGVVWVHDALKLYAFDLAGQTNCAGTPKVCLPLWTAAGVGSIYPLPVAWANNLVYIVGGAGLAVFDANGQSNCSGTPTICLPLWTGALGAGQSGVAVVGTTAYTAGASVYAYDAAGSSNCSGTPKVCQPLWSGMTGTSSQTFSPLAVANGKLYVEGPGKIVALDASGTTNCSGTPVVCQPLWTGAIGAAASSANLNSAPAVGGGVVYIGSEDHNLYGFDAAGQFNCSANSCKPLWHGSTGDMVRSSPAIASGRIFVGSNDSTLYAYGNAAVLVNVTGSALSNMTAQPAPLSPAFATSTNDYVVPCQSGTNSITLLMSGSSGTITVGGVTGASVSTNVNLVESQAAIVTAPDPANPSGPPTQYWVRCLPHDFPKIQATKPGSPTPGYYLYGNVTAAPGISSTYNMILNGNGTPVWFQKTPSGPLGLQLLPNNTLVYGLGQQSPFFLLQLDTQTTQLVNAPIGLTDVHEFLLESNGDRMVLGVPTKSGVDLTSLGKGTNQTILDCVVQEIDPQGNLVWSWRASDHIGVSETQPALLDTVTINGQTVYGPYHCNSIDVDSTGTRVLLSARADSAVYDINKSTGTVVWKLGGSGTNPDNAQVLSIHNDPEITISGQHDARFQPNGDVALFDDQSAALGAARGVQYAINTTTGTATMDFQYADPDGTGSFATGSFRRLADGSSIIGWGFHAGSGFTEIDASGHVLFTVTFPNNENGYRSLKIPTSALSINLLRDTVGLIGTAPS